MFQQKKKSSKTNSYLWLNASTDDNDEDEDEDEEWTSLETIISLQIIDLDEEKKSKLLIDTAAQYFVYNQ